MTEGMKGKLREPGGFEGGLHIVGHIVRTDGCEIRGRKYQVTGPMVREVELHAETVGLLRPEKGNSGIVNGKGPSGAGCLSALCNNRRPSIPYQAGLTDGNRFPGEIYILPPEP